MSRLIPDGFLTIRQAADQLAVAIYSGVSDRPIVKQHRESGFDVADGEAVADSISKVWAAVDSKKLQAFLVGATGQVRLKLPAEMSKGVPGLRSPKGGDFHLLRPRHPYYSSVVNSLGCKPSAVTVVFRETDISRLARTRLKARRRKVMATSTNKRGRPPLQIGVEGIILNVVDKGRWSPTQTIKALTREVNRRAEGVNPISDDTVGRALDKLHRKTGDRRLERVRRKT